MAARPGSRPPKKIFHKIGEVCELTKTEPYVLRYWESEFPFLAPEKNRAGQRIYTDEDIQTVLAIKRLLYEEGYTTAGARGGGSRRKGRATTRPPPSRLPWRRPPGQSPLQPPRTWRRRFARCVTGCARSGSFSRRARPAAPKGPWPFPRVSRPGPAEPAAEASSA